MPAPVCIKFDKQKEETNSCKMHIVILKLLHFYLYNLSYKSDTMLSHHLHITAVFVNLVFSDKDKILTKPLTSGQFDYVHV